jgi:hypothetical protein
VKPAGRVVFVVQMVAAIVLVWFIAHDAAAHAGTPLSARVVCGSSPDSIATVIDRPAKAGARTAPRIFPSVTPAASRGCGLADNRCRCE